MITRTAFQVGAFQFTGFQEAQSVTVDFGGGRLFRYPRGAPIVLPAELYPRREPLLEPIAAVAHSSGSALVGRATVTLSVVSVANSVGTARTLAKVRHDSFPIAAIARTWAKSAHADSVATLSLPVTANSGQGSQTFAKVSMSLPAVANGAQKNSGNACLDMILFAAATSEQRPTVLAKVDHDPELHAFMQKVLGLVDTLDADEQEEQTEGV